MNQPYFLANNLVLDFINSEYGTSDEYHDYLSDDESTVAWLKSAGCLPTDYSEVPLGISEKAKKLRTVSREMIDSAISAVEYDPVFLNNLLDRGKPAEYIEWDNTSNNFKRIKQRKNNNIESLLEPIGNSLATLLCSEEIRSIRQCEAHDCTLVFLDKTKSHRRRWCSMSLCGNRKKVAAFRSRKQLSD